MQELIVYGDLIDWLLHLPLKISPRENIADRETGGWNQTGSTRRVFNSTATDHSNFIRTLSVLIKRVLSIEKRRQSGITDDGVDTDSRQ